MINFHELNKRTQRGSEDFPIQFYPITPVHPRYTMPLHWHKEFEIIRVLSGHFHLFLANTEYVLSSGDIAFVSSGTLHRGDPDRCLYECIVFDLNMLRRYSGDGVGARIVPILSGSMTVDRYHRANSAEFCKTADALFDCLRAASEYYELSVYGLLFTLFAQLYASGAIHPVSGRHRNDRRNEAMIAILNWIELHYKEQITLEQLASISGMNEKYLCHLFKEFTDHTPIDYINRLRIEQACHEIHSNRLSITEAAYESGFNDLSYFSRTFRKYKGFSPSAYRRRNEKKMPTPGHVKNSGEQ